MATRRPAPSPVRTPPGSPAPLFGVFLILWIAFAVGLIFNQGALDTVWRHFLDLPLVLQVIGWILLLPITLGLWIWESDWALWLRLVLIVMIAVGNLVVLGPKPQQRREDASVPPDLGTDRPEISPSPKDTERRGKDGTMNAMVVYDSKFGNTERLARVIAETLGVGEPVPVVAVSEVGAADLAGLDLLAVGGPTQAHGLSPGLRAFLDRLPAQAVRDIPTVTFDTRLTWPRFLAGSAAAAAAKRLQKQGAWLLVPPESFLVAGSEGPMLEGELERARSWATAVRATAGPPEREPVAAGR